MENQAKSGEHFDNCCLGFSWIENSMAKKNLLNIEHNHKSIEMNGVVLHVFDLIVNSPCVNAQRPIYTFKYQLTLADKA